MAMSRKKIYTPASAAHDVNAVLQLLRGRWKLLILFHLFDAKIQRLSDLERLIDGISQKCWLSNCAAWNTMGCSLEPFTKPIRVDYRLTVWGQQLCPMLDGMLKWADCRGLR
jgi:DNA-binding HxlR family transcriptional regulator